MVLQQDLKHLEKWESEWDMSSHPDRCSHLLFTRSQKNSNPNYTLHGQTLETVSSSKYLGLTIQRNLGWDRHIDSMCAKANKMVGFLRRNLEIDPRKVKERACKTLIRPILEYASSVWDPDPTSASPRLKWLHTELLASPLAGTTTHLVWRKRWRYWSSQLFNSVGMLLASPCCTRSQTAWHV